jgi:hypothetical protein
MLPLRFGKLLNYLQGSSESEHERDHGPNLHRIDPLLLYNIFDALKRYDFELLSKLSRDLGVSLDSLQDLAVDGQLLGAGQLGEVLDAVAHHPKYNDIMQLAGRNSFALQSARDGKLRRQVMPLMVREIGQRLLPFMGDSLLDIDLKGKVIILRITNSIFAEGRYSLSALCGFYVGYLQQLGQDCGFRRLDAGETRCACQDEEQHCCLIHVST